MGLLARAWPPEPGSATIADDGEEAMGRDSADSLAVVVFREDGVWQSGVLPERVTDDLEGLIAVARQQPGENGSLALVNVADEFFVAVRVRGEEVRLLLSDVTAAVAWDLARQVVDRLGIPTPGEDDLADVEDLDGVVDVLRQAVGDDTEVALMLFEENDEWFGIVRIDDDTDPRVFVSDGRVVETSAIGAILGEAAAVQDDEDDDEDDEEGDDEDEDDDVRLAG